MSLGGGGAGAASGAGACCGCTLREAAARHEQRVAANERLERANLEWKQVVCGRCLFYSDASADGVEERSLVPRSRSHARFRRNATMSRTFSCVQSAFSNL
ncbi:hypothetical protein EVAR_63316_1 [Eumeta japonica]|uniref:Uncharacterized protein n=1 Tax=Eumeta variegata TaxID=151549 RepID=A0A4C1YQS2_EUMVA|nr:hypothetical protein EVAR_63316_1 [Eumeta japonica]